MAITFVDLDPGTREVLSAYYPTCPPFDLALPHRVYTLAVDDIRRAVWRPIGPIAVRVMEVVDDHAVGACEVSAGLDGTPSLTHRTVDSPYLQGTFDALGNLERAATVRDAEFRLLRVPFLPLVAGWLYDRSGDGADLLAPIAPTPQGLPSVTIWTPAELIAALSALV